MNEYHLRAILVCVDYADLLAVTLPYNRHHFGEVLVVVANGGSQDAYVARRNDCQVFVTEAFYLDGASFNKWRALEAALDYWGRHGWLCIMDADVLWPKVLKPAVPFQIGKLYSPLRHMHEDLGRRFSHLADPYGSMNPPSNPYLFPPESDWWQYPIHRNVTEWAGYTQIFHASDPALGAPPWHEVDWVHAGGADSFFQRRWPPLDKIRTPWNVLHLGPAGRNWYGRATPYLDGSVPPEALLRMEKMHSTWQGRLGKKGPGMFDHEKL